MEEARLEQAGESASAPKARRARVWWGIAVVVLVTVAILGIWLGLSGTWKTWGAVARMDGKRITQADLDQHLEVLIKQGRIRSEALADPARKKEAERSALEDLITRRILLAEAQRLKIEVGPGEEDAVFQTAHGGKPGDSTLADAAKKAGQDLQRYREDVRRQILLTRLADKITEDVKVTDDDVAKYFEGHRQTFTTPGEAHLDLLIAESQEGAERLRAQAMKGTSFVDLIRESAKGGGKVRGGEMGWVDSRMLPAAIAKAVDAIPKTGITPAIEAKGGFYVLRVMERRPPRQVPMAEAKDHITKLLIAERKQARFGEWLAERRRASKIELYL